MSTYVVLFKYTKYVLNKQNYFYKKKKRDEISQFVIAAGLEPATHRTKICCSTNLNYATIPTYLLI